ncbi:MAG: RDD family protein [Prevotella sp.]|nr:RDD family protein [Prevotella sp.]
MPEPSFLTGQYVQLQLTPASVGDRIAAQLIDWCVMLAYAVLMARVLKELNAGFSTNILVVVLPLFFYTLLCELFNNGQSVGKMLMKTRVVKADGSTPTIGAFLIRWLMYMVDGPLLSYAGVLVMILNRRNQRIGDMAAGTMVVKLKKYKDIQVSLDEYDFLESNYKPRYPQAADLSLEQIEIVSRTLAMKNDDFLPRTAALANKVAQKLGIERQEASDTAFLQRIVRDYQYYALEEI